jgi:hypothetical protein
MTNYDEVINSGDNAPSVVLGDLSSPLIRLINREKLDYSDPMPPSRALRPEIIEIFERWVAGGAPETAAEAAAARSATAP